MPSQTVGTTSTAVAPENAGRKAISFRNASIAGQIIYIDNTQPGGLTAGNAGHPLSVGESLHFLLEFDGPDIQGPWSAIASGAGATLYHKEYSVRPGGI